MEAKVSTGITKLVKTRNSNTEEMEEVLMVCIKERERADAASPPPLATVLIRCSDVLIFLPLTNHSTSHGSIYRRLVI